MGNIEVIPGAAHLKLQSFAPIVTATYSVESDFLIKSNRVKLNVFINKLNKNDELLESELMDAFISLHILLEVGINTVLRKVSLRRLNQAIESLVAVRDLDEVAFRDKVSCLIYFGSFNPDLEKNKFSENETILNEIKKFCEPRNRLLHGHAVIAIGDQNGIKKSTTTSALLNNPLFMEQLSRYYDIVNRLYYYLCNLEPALNNIDELKTFLDNSFIPVRLIEAYSKTYKVS